MPGRRTRKDNPEPSVHTTILHGACNERVPTPEGKMRSELHGNMKRITETLIPDTVVGVA